MANNIKGNAPNAVVASATVSFASAGITSSNTSIIYLVDQPLQSYIPGRDINAITGFVAGKGYYFVAKQDMDLSAYLIPPVPTSGGGDVTAPTIASKNTTDATHVAIVFSEVVTTSGVTGFSFRKNGSALAASAVSGSGTNTLTFTVGTIANGDTLDVSYNPSTGNCQDGSGNELATVSNSAITNNISAPSNQDFLAEFSGGSGTALSAYTPEIGTIGTITGSPTLNGSSYLNMPAGSSFISNSINSASVLLRMGPGVVADGASLYCLLGTAGSSNAYITLTRNGSNFTFNSEKDDADVTGGVTIAIANIKEIMLKRTGNTLDYRYKDSSDVEHSVATADITGYVFTYLKAISTTGASLVNYVVAEH